MSPPNVLCTAACAVLTHLLVPTVRSDIGDMPRERSHGPSDAGAQLPRPAAAYPSPLRADVRIAVRIRVSATHRARCYVRMGFRE